MQRNTISEHALQVQVLICCLLFNPAFQQSMFLCQGRRDTVSHNLMKGDVCVVTVSHLKQTNKQTELIF